VKAAAGDPIESPSAMSWWTLAVLVVYALVVPGNNGMFMPTLVSDGRVVGTWKRTLNKRAVRVTAQPFDTLSEVEEDAFAAATQRYGRFLAQSVTTG